MAALTTLFPVFFMLGLGYLSKVKRWVSIEQKLGANTIVFTVLFPIMIVKLIAAAQLKASIVGIVAYTFIVYLIAIVVGKLTTNFSSREYKHFSPFLLATNEGGSVALPLYLSIVGVSSTTVIFDLAGATMAFLVVPILVAQQTNRGKSVGILAREIFSHPFVIAIILGLFLNLSGLYQALLSSPFNDLFQATVSTATAPIVSIILFVLGYDLSIDLQTIRPILRLMLVRVSYYIIVILGFFLLFPKIMADKEFMIAVFIYFMCPTGFAVPTLIHDVFKSKHDMTFASTFISLYIIVTLIAYTAVVLFIV